MRRYAAAPYGLAMAKGNGLDKAVLAALKVLMKNGTYQAIFNKWGLKSARDHQPENQRRDQLAGKLRLRGEHLRAFCRGAHGTA